jgi:hypothetical protein
VRTVCSHIENMIKGVTKVWRELCGTVRVSVAIRCMYQVLFSICIINLFSLATHKQGYVIDH